MYFSVFFSVSVIIFSYYFSYWLSVTVAVIFNINKFHRKRTECFIQLTSHQYTTHHQYFRHTVHCVSKNCAKLFLSKLRQIFTTSLTAHSMPVHFATENTQNQVAHNISGWLQEKHTLLVSSSICFDFRQFKSRYTQNTLFPRRPAMQVQTEGLVPEMTYYVSSGTSNSLAQIGLAPQEQEVETSLFDESSSWARRSLLRDWLGRKLLKIQTISVLLDFEMKLCRHCAHRWQWQTVSSRWRTATSTQ